MLETSAVISNIHWAGNSSYLPGDERNLRADFIFYVLYEIFDEYHIYCAKQSARRMSKPN